MATEVSAWARMLGGYVDERREAQTDTTKDLVTRDFLGGGGGVQELDLDLAAPAGWERRLDLKSGKVFLQRTVHATAAPAANETERDRSPPPLLPLFPSPTLDLGLVHPPPTEYQSVCTLDKVRSALDRLASAPPANKPARPNNRCSASSSRSASGSCSGSDSLCRSVSPTSSSTTTSSMQRRNRQLSRDAGDSGTTTEEDGAEHGGGGHAMVATGCPSCLSYVLISCTRPRCPRCGAYVSPPQAKKPRLDLNLNTFSAADRPATSSRRS